VRAATQGKESMPLSRSARLVVVAVWLVAAAPAWARDYVGVVGGYVSPTGTTADFAEDGYALELRWRHHNRGRSAFEFEFGYMEAGVGGEIQETIDFYAARVRDKNQFAQLQGGPGDGFVVAENGTFQMFYFGPNFLFFPLKQARLNPFASFGAGLYDWRLPFRIQFVRTPFFGEQHAYDPLLPDAQPFYAGVLAYDEIDFTKHETAPGLSVAGGATLNLSRSFELGATARYHYLFSSGAGDREAGVDDQDYLDNMSFLFLKGALHWRF
jgi:hypothetical protein